VLALFALHGTSVVGGLNVGLVALAINATVAVMVGYARSLLRSGARPADSPTR